MTVPLGRFGRTHRAERDDEDSCRVSAGTMGPNRRWRGLRRFDPDANGFSSRMDTDDRQSVPPAAAAAKQLRATDPEITNLLGPPVAILEVESHHRIVRLHQLDEDIGHRVTACFQPIVAFAQLADDEVPVFAGVQRLSRGRS